eukprot:1011360_1
MWKQIGLLVVVYLTLGQSMDSGSPEFSSDSDNIDRTGELYLINEVQTTFTKWQQSKPLIGWPDDKIVKHQRDAMNHVFDRFSDFGGTAFGDFILLIDDYHGGELNRDDTSTDLLAATIEMNAAAQQEMDRVISVILKNAGGRNGPLSKVAHHIPSNYYDVRVPMDKVQRKIEVFEKSLCSNIHPWMRENLDTMYYWIKDAEKEENSGRRSTPAEKMVFDMASKEAGPLALAELSDPVQLPEPAESSIWQWFPLCFLLGMIIGTILMAKFYFKKEE